MKKIKQMLSFITVILVFVLVISACAGNQAGTTQTQTEKSGSGDTVTTQSREMEGNMYLTGLPILKETGTYTLMVPANPYSTIKWSEKYAVQQTEKETNVKMEWEEIPQAGWAEKVNISFSANELPDAFLGEIPYETILKNIDVLLPLNDMIEKYSPTVQKLFEDYPYVKDCLTFPNGKIYSLVINQMQKADETTSAVYWINSDWLKNLNLEAPTTVDELYDVLVAFRDRDPNGNGQKDEIPLSFCNNNWAGSISSLFGSFGVLARNDHVVIENGKVIFQPTEPGFYEALKYLNKLCSEGLLDPEGFSMPSAQYTAKISQGNLGVFPVYFPANMVGNDNPYVPLLPLKAEGYETLWDGQKEGGMGKRTGFVINKECKNPQVLIRWYDYINSDLKRRLTWNYGQEGILWEMESTDGQWTQLTTNLKPDEVWDRVRYTLGCATDAPCFFTPDECQQIVDHFVDQRYEAVRVLEDYYPKEYFPLIFEDPEYVSERNLLKVEIDAYIKNFIADSVMNSIDDQKWQAHLEKCKALKVDKYVEMLQKTFDDFKAH